MITSDMGTWVVSSLLILLIAEAVNMVVGLPFQFALQSQINRTILSPNPGASPYATLSGLLPFYGLSYLIGLPMQGLLYVLNGGLMEMAVRRMEGRPVSIGDVFSGFSHFGELFLTGIAASIITAIGFVFCCLPAFILYGIFSFAPLMIMRGRARGGISALGASAQVLKGDLWMITLLVFCAQLLSGLGFIACCVGGLFTYAIGPITIALTYLNFFPPGQAVGHEGPSNYFRP